MYCEPNKVVNTYKKNGKDWKISGVRSENIHVIIKIIRTWPSGLRRYAVTRKNPVHTPLSAWPGFGTQPYYEATGDIQVESRIKSSN